MHVVNHTLHAIIVKPIFWELDNTWMQTPSPSRVLKGTLYVSQLQFGTHGLLVFTWFLTEKDVSSAIGLSTC